MAETQPIPTVPVQEPLRYWCYHCDKRVSIETLTSPTDIICYDCKNGFVESIPAITSPSSSSPTSSSDPNRLLSHQFLRVLRLLSEELIDDDGDGSVTIPVPTPDLVSDRTGTDVADPPGGEDFLRFNLDGWGDDNDEDVDDDDDDHDDDEDEADEDFTEISHSDVSNADRVGNLVAVGEGDGDQRRNRRDILRLRIRDFAARAGGERGRRNRILDWSEILMGLEDTAIELSIEMPGGGSDGYVGNPEDYVDAAGYEALLQNLAESDSGGRRGAPPASSSAVLALKKSEITSDEGVLTCAICKDSGEIGEIAMKMPCGHGYHEDCIVAWLGSRNSCPICRFELPTDDQEYEERRKKSMASYIGGPSDSGGE